MENDEWFFKSFKRYDELQMFDFPRTVREMDLTSKNNLCVALENNVDANTRHEILVFRFPNSIQSGFIQDWKVDRNLSFDQGYFTNSRLIQIECLSRDEKLIISEEDGVSLLEINCEDTDCIRKLSTISCAIQNSRISANSTRRLVALSGPGSNNKIILNYETLNILLQIEETGINLKKPLFTSENTISFIDVVNGQVSLYDIRNGENICTLIVSETLSSKSANTRWIPDTTFNARGNHSDNTNANFYLFSTDGTFLVYDSRNTSTPSIYANHSLCCDENTNSVKMNVHPLNKNRISVCGYDENVYVGEIKESKVEMTFMHDGHSYNKDDFECGVQTICSQWLPFVSPNTLISSGSNTSVQVWQYKIS